MDRAVVMSNVRQVFRFAAALAALGFVMTALAIDLKIATVAPDGSHLMQQMRAGAE